MADGPAWDSGPQTRAGLTRARGWRRHTPEWTRAAVNSESVDHRFPGAPYRLGPGSGAHEAGRARMILESGSVTQRASLLGALAWVPPGSSTPSRPQTPAEPTGNLDTGLAGGLAPGTALTVTNKTTGHQMDSSRCLVWPQG